MARPNQKYYTKEDYEEMWQNHPRRWVEYHDRYKLEPYEPEEPFELSSFKVDESDL